MNPKRSLYLGKFLGLEIRVAPSAVLTAVLMGGGIFLLLHKAFKWRPWTAVTGGILATTIHYLSEMWHQIGHARAAETYLLWVARRWGKLGVETPDGEASDE